MNKVIPCVLMRAGTSRGPFFLRDWLPADEAARNEVLIGAIGASDLLQVDGVGGGSTLTSKVAIVSRSGLDLARFGQRYSHTGVSLKGSEVAPWSVRQLYYACEEKKPRIFDQGLTAFLLGMSSPAGGYVSAVFLPDEAAASASPVLQVDTLRLDPGARRAWRGEREVELSKTEFDLLELLVFNAGIVMDRTRIYEEIWGYDFGPDSKNLAVYISYLRRKVDTDREPLIHTVRGVGYVMRPPRAGDAE